MLNPHHRNNTGSRYRNAISWSCNIFAVKGNVAAATNGFTLIKFLAIFNPAKSPPAVPEAVPPPRLFLIVLRGLSLIEVSPKYPFSFNFY